LENYTVYMSKKLFGHVQHDLNHTVLDELRRLQEAKQLTELKLLNYYKEVPISSVARSFRFVGDALVCRTNETQARAIEFTKHAIVKSKDLTHHIYASAHYSADTREVTLSDFSYVDVLPEHRESVRVRMHIPIAVLIESGLDQFKGRLIDLSLDGCAVDVAQCELQGSKVCVYLNIETHLKERRHTVRVRVMARFLKAEHHHKVSRCVFLFMHDKGSEDLIGKIIALRQGEIIRELR